MEDYHLYHQFSCASPTACACIPTGKRAKQFHTFRCYAILDGHGGKEVAELMSEKFPSIIEENVARFYDHHKGETSRVFGLIFSWPELAGFWHNFGLI